MGTSHPETKPWVIERILALPDAHALTILDVGAGSGGWSDALRAAGFSGGIDAVEVWRPYVRDFALHKKYGDVHNVDVREWREFDYDVVIFGDVLEHMSVADALDVWARAALQARYAVIAIPIIHYCQGALNGNPYEEHVKDDWTDAEVLATFPGIVASQAFSVTGAYWADFTKG